jgi:tRNA (guanine-N7-)-methyltransferase
LSPAKPDSAALTAATSADTDALRHRPIRSFVVRAGRMTGAQERAWRELWPALGIENEDGLLDFSVIFGRNAPLVLEIGFGNGESLVALAAAHPARDHLGLEVHPPGVGHLLLRCDTERLRNVRVICDDAVQVLQRRVPDASLDQVLLYFPDPWPKKRHHKRRIVQPEFIALLARKLKSCGVLRMASDWQPYAEHMLATVGGCDLLRNESATGDFVVRPDSRPPTRFERRGQRLGHGVWDLAFRRI